jgi:hypothetical protein
MLLTFQGYFEQGRIIPTAQIQVPEHKKLTITVSDEVDATVIKTKPKSSIEKKRAAFYRLVGLTADNPVTLEEARDARLSKQ